MEQSEVKLFLVIFEVEREVFLVIRAASKKVTFLDQRVGLMVCDHKLANFRFNPLGNKDFNDNKAVNFVAAVKFKLEYALFTI